MTEKASRYIYEVALEFAPTWPGLEDILTEIMIGQGVAPEKIVQSQRNGKGFLAVYLKDSLQAARFKKRLEKCKFKNVSVKRTRLLNKDWQTKWQKDFKPLWLTKKFRVVPAWYRKEARFQKKNSLFIDTSVAFGTGMHPTTRFTAQLVEQRAEKLENFLDIGTGTGILSILAYKCGAKTIDAIDLSSDAIKIAESNFKLNNCRPDCLQAVDLKSFQPKRKYDFVAANLVTDDLIKMSRNIFSLVKPHGYLAISGVSLNNFTLVKSHFKKYPLHCLRVLKGEGWTAMLFKNKKKIRKS